MAAKAKSNSTNNHIVRPKQKGNTVATHTDKPKVSRPGVHAKSKSSKLKSSKNYTKLYKAQGK